MAIIHKNETAQALGLEIYKSSEPLSEKFYSWLAQDYNFASLFESFWNLNAKIRLLAVSNNLDKKLWQGLVSQWDSFSEQAGQFRLNKDLIQNLLDLSLGEIPVDFDLKNLTSIEMKIFENFFVELENHWRDYWRVGEPKSEGSLSFLVFAIEFENERTGLLAIGIPSNLLPSSSASESKSPISMKEMALSLDLDMRMDLSIGKTRLSVSEIKNIEKGDLIYFEDSNHQQIVWEQDDLNSFAFNISLPSKEERAGSYYEDLEIGKMMEQEKIQDDVLADLPVELTAQFKGVDMPLQKVMELEAGGVLPLGLLMDSQMTLIAPGNKPIAQGELIIIGNQFGMKINKVSLRPDSVQNASLSDYPPVDEGLLAQSLAEPHGANPGMGAAEDLAMPMEGDVLPEEEQAPEASYNNQLDQELADIGLDPKEFDDLDDLDEEDF